MLSFCDTVQRKNTETFFNTPFFNTNITVCDSTLYYTTVTFCDTALYNSTVTL